MKERPVLFYGPMVRALLAGTKMQTRRRMKVQPSDDTSVTVEYFIQTVVDRQGDEQPGPEIFGAWWHCGESGLICPYGAPGDRLWVRENGYERPSRTAKMMREGADTWEPYYYDADGISWQDAEDFRAWDFKRRPSIHMPHWASRITLEVIEVRVERLQDISEADAIAEGVAQLPGQHGQAGAWWTGDVECGPRLHGRTARDAFRLLWESISGVSSWEANPWVWVVGFRAVNAPVSSE